jgi:hypothetical protein
MQVETCSRNAGLEGWNLDATVLRLPLRLASLAQCSLMTDDRFKIAAGDGGASIRKSWFDDFPFPQV